MNKLFMAILSTTLVSLPVLADSCRDRIIEKTCLVNKPYRPDKNQNYPWNMNQRMKRKCLRGSLAYGLKFLKIYDILPEESQKSFCYVKKIFIVPDERVNLASASVSFDYKNPINHPRQRSVVGFRSNGFVLKIAKEELFDTDDTALVGVNNYTKSIFGRRGMDDAIAFDGLYKYGHFGSSQKSMLYEAVLHEIGHFLSFANIESLNKKSKNADFEADWSNLAWQRIEHRGRYFIRPLLPEALPSRPFKEEDMSGIFQNLHSSPFTSLRSLVSPAEDFAEFYRYVMLEGRYLPLDFSGEKVVITKNRPSKFYLRLELMKYYREKGFSSIMNRDVSWFKK